MGEILLSIFVIQVIYVSAFTLRMILTLKGQKYIAAAISTVEITIYVLGLNLVLQYLDQFLSLVVYALGYALGILVGAWLEEKIALGYITLKVISDHTNRDMAHRLREQGYGVTSWIGHGRDGDRLVMEILSKRKNQQKLYKAILGIDPKAFVIVIEPKQFHGGFWTSALKKADQ
ncbi:hypothetical protein SY83_08115 [Paenibacillus swuensis]|uniref:UPF0316 protein SY83_08115 n=1 Tax=Paenibacillus swuensis TaxID=1178515 RepID=A0A172TGS9_9BACL|nr:DUF2179 domain-containing protein [Paenibacillus swuensis]ANE46241.1 hypothetical protein SY83_08115 [Paenibacillus swuensis]